MTAHPSEPVQGASDSRPRSPASKLWTLVKIALALLLVGVVLSRTEVAQLLALRRHIAASWLLASLVLFLLLTAIKTLQYHVFFRAEVTYPQMLQVVILQNALTNFIATGAGIASFLTSLKVERGVRLSHSSLAFLFTKTGDFFALWCFLGLSLWRLWPQVTVLRGVAMGLMGLLGAGLMGIAAAVTLRRRFMELARRGLEGTRLRRLGPARRGLEATRLRRLGPARRGLEALEDVLSQGTLMEAAVLGRASLISLVYLALTTVWMYASLRAFGVQIGMMSVVFVNVFIQLLSNLPIHVFGGLGVSEATSLYLYGFFYPDQGELAAALIGFRLLFYLMNLLVLAYIPAHAVWRRRH